MSTEINISVGDEPLIDQLRLQQNANRQTLLERDNEKDVQVKAIDARTEQLASQGKDASDNSLYGTRIKQPQIDRRPAANIATKTALLWYFTEAPNPSETGRFGSIYATNNTYLLKNARQTPATRQAGEEEELIYNFLAAEGPSSIIFVPGSPENGVFGQNIIEFPINTTEFINRVEWTCFNGQSTNFDGTSSLVYIDNPTRPEFTLEYDILIGTYSDTGGQIRLFNSVTDATTSDSNVVFDYIILPSFGFFQIYSDAPEFFFGESFYANGNGPYIGEEDLPEEEDYTLQNMYPPGRTWVRYAFTLTSNEILLHVNGIFKRSFAFNPSILLGFEAVGWIIDGSVFTNSETPVPSLSAVRFTQKALYRKQSYTPRSLLSNLGS